MKTPTLFKRQQFEDRGNNEMEPKASKCQCLDQHDNKERNGLDEDAGEIEGARYVPPPFVPFSPLS